MAITHGWTSAASPDGSDVTPTNMNAHTIANDTVTEAMLSVADNTTKNVSTSAHGFTPKAPNDALKFLRGDATWGSYDPVYSLFGTPDTAFEFDTSSLTGLTAIGTPDVENADTTVPDCLYYKDDTAATAWMGRYVVSPPTPFTAVVRVLDSTLNANYNGSALMVGVADPTTGAFVTCAAVYNAGAYKILQEKFTNRTTYVSTAGAWEHPYTNDAYLAMVVNSTTSIDYYASFNGWVWRKFVSANNPSLTVGSVGVVMKSENANGFACAFDFLRIWNNAKTFPGA